MVKIYFDFVVPNGRGSCGDPNFRILNNGERYSDDKKYHDSITKKKYIVARVFIQTKRPIEKIRRNDDLVIDVNLPDGLKAITFPNGKLRGWTIERWSNKGDTEKSIKYDSGLNRVTFHHDQVGFIEPSNAGSRNNSPCDYDKSRVENPIFILLEEAPQVKTGRKNLSIDYYMTGKGVKRETACPSSAIAISHSNPDDIKPTPPTPAYVNPGLRTRVAR